jgi:hypothetical protein
VTGHTCRKPAWLIGALIGCAIVTMQEALMFTDGRYFLQAADQMDECVLSICLCNIRMLNESSQ